MFCAQCGNEIKDEWLICPQCGMVLRNVGDRKKLIKQKKRLKKPHIILGVMFALFVVAVIVLIILDEADDKKSISKLKNCTTAYADENRCCFENDTQEWVLIYTSENEVVNMKNDAVIRCFTDWFGENCISEEGVSNLGFAYDLSEEEALFFLDVDIEEGHLSLIAYNFDDKEYRGMVDGEWRYLSESFEDFIKEYNLVQTMKEDIKDFEDEIKENDLNIQDLLSLDYEQLKKQGFEEKKIKSTTEVEYSSDNDVYEVDELWFVDNNIFFSGDGDFKLEVWCQNDVMLYVSICQEEEIISHIFDVEPNKIGEKGELSYVSEDGGIMIYYPNTQSIYYDNNQGLLSGEYYSN